MYTKCWFHLAILLYEVINIAVQRGQGCGLIHPQKSDSLSETCQYVYVDDHAGGSQVMQLMSHQSCCLPTFHRRRCLLCRRGCSWKFHWKELVVIQFLDNTWNCATHKMIVRPPCEFNNQHSVILQATTEISEICVLSVETINLQNIKLWWNNNFMTEKIQRMSSRKYF